MLLDNTGKHSFISSRAFSTLVPLTIWWDHFCCVGCPVYCRTFSNILDFYPQVLVATPTPSCDDNKCLWTLPNVPGWEWGTELSLVESHWFLHMNESLTCNRYYHMLGTLKTSVILQQPYKVVTVSSVL